MSMANIGMGYGGVVALTLVVATAALPAFWVNAWQPFRCGGKQDGFYVDDASRCQNYHICQHGKAYTYTCPPSMLFDLRAQSCQPEADATCLQNGERVGSLSSIARSRFDEVKRGLMRTDCDNKPSGFYADKLARCKQFYECVNGEKRRQMACSYGTIFDESTMSCVPETVSGCPQSAKPIRLESRQIKFFFPAAMAGGYSDGRESEQ